MCVGQDWRDWLTVIVMQLFAYSLAGPLPKPVPLPESSSLAFLQKTSKFQNTNENNMPMIV